MSAGLPKTIKIEALFGFTSRVARGRVKFSHVIAKGLTLLSSIKLSIFKKAGIFILLFLIFIPSRSFAQKIKTEKFFDSKLGREVQVIEGEILIRFKPGLAAEKIKGINQSHGNKTRKHIKKINIHRIQLGKGKKIENMLKMYRKNPNVVFAEPNFVAETFTTTPSDLSFSQQWGLTKIYAPEAWDIEKGNSNVIIAIVDTGIDLDHPDLNEKIVPGYDFVNEDIDPMDDHGHGTHCAGIAAAESDNAQGITGVAWGSKLMPVKALDSAGQGAYSDVAEGIIYAADNGAKVINLSLGAYSYSQTLQDTVDYAYQKGCVIVAAAGNDNTNELLYPAAYNNVIGVAATDQNDERWTSSNYGDYIDVSAPGVNIYSTSLDNIYSSANGTSCSAPFVSGIAALILSQDSTLANYEVENKIRQSADDLGTAGRDDYYGYGRINACNALVNEPDAVHDVAIIGLDVEPTEVNPGKSTFVTVVAQNQGNYIEQNLSVELFLDDKEIDKAAISSLKPGESKNIQLSWIPVSSELVQTIKATVEELIEESDISDNTKERRYNVIVDQLGKIRIMHARTVHQYICKEAAEIFGRNETNGEITGGQYLYSGSSWSDDMDTEVNTICGGAYSEDGDDRLTLLTDEGTEHFPPTVTPSVRHFWNADVSDDTKTQWVAENAWWKVQQLWLRSSYDEEKRITALYSSNKGKAYDILGHIAHLIADMSVPAHAHGVHGGVPLINDESYEDWMESNYDDWYVSGSSILRYNQHGSQNLGNAELINIPWSSRPSTISKDVFPLYYLMYTMNQYADYFAADGDTIGGENLSYSENPPNGDVYQRRSGWNDYTGFPNHPTKTWHLTTNNTVSSANPPYPAGGNKDNDAGNNDDDKDLTLIGDNTIPYAIRAIATLYKFFWDSVHPLPAVSANYSTFSLSLGEQQTVTFTVANSGAETSLDAYLTMSVSDGLDIVSWSSDDGQYSGGNPNGMHFSHKYPGNSDYDKDGNPITLQHELLDCYEKYDQNETRTITVTFEAVSSGSQWIKYRATFDDVAEGTYYVSDPSSSGYTDQQGWNVYLIPVSGGNPPTSISATENLNPSTCPPYTSVTVSGNAIYNNNPDWPVSAGTALIEISGVNTWTAALDSNGNYSRQITAPGSLGTYTVKVTVSDGSLSGSTQKNLEITGEGGGTGYTFSDSLVCQDVQSTSPYDPINEIYAFGDDDARVYVWVKLTEVYISFRFKCEWYRPNGSLYGTYTSGWTEAPPEGAYVEWYKMWSYYGISGTERADIEGEWSVKIYVDDGSGFDYKATEYFTIRYNLTEHKMCQDVQASQPYDPTNIFYQTDEKAMTWMNLDDVSNSLEVKWDFYEPNGNLYTTFTFTTDDPNSGGYDYWDYRCWGWIGINGNSAASKCGDWEVKVHIKNASGSWDHKYTDYFKILESPNVNPTVSVSASPGSPTEADSVSLQINASDNTYLKKIILYSNDGTEPSKTWDNVIATSYSPSYNIGTYLEGQEIEYYARAYDTSGNFTESVHKTLIVQDSDTAGPVISNVKVEEYNGNGNSNIEEGEQIKISWSLSDPNGISSTSIFVEGVEKTVQGTYYSIIDPYSTGSHSYTIIAADNDTSPATSSYWGSFTVELITSYVNATIGNDNYDGSSPTYEGANVGPKKTIQAGIDASVGTCYVPAGTYYENIDISHEVSLIGEGPDTTVIDGAGSGNVVIIGHPEVPLTNATISGFTITHSGSFGDNAGIRIQNSTATVVSNNILINNNDGIRVYDASPTIVNNTVCNNRRGIMVHGDSSQPVIKNNIVAYHSMSGLYASDGAVINSSYNDVWGNGTNYEGCSPGTGDLSLDPMFVDYSNYHLQQDSPCMDAGDPASDYSNEPEPNGDRINMGAYGNTEKATLTKIPEVLKVTLSDPDPVKASTNFVITVQFNKTLDTSIEPVITLNSTGSADPSVASGGSWSSSAKANDTYTTPAIVLDSTMEGEITISIANAQDSSGNVMFPDSSHTFTLDTTAPTASISISPVSPLKTGKVNVNLLISDASEILKTPSLSYRPFGGSLIDIPLTGSDKNWSGSLYIESITPEGTAEFTWFGADAAGNSGTTITLGRTFEIDTTINASIGGDSSNSDGSRVDVPAGTFSEDVNIRIAVPASDSPLIRDADANIGDDLSIRPISTESTAREIITESDSTGKEIKDFKESIVITIAYLDENQDGIVDETEIKENSLKMFYLDENARKWILIENSKVNPIYNNVTANVNHLSIFCIMAYIQSSDFANITVFPNPWYSDKHRAENIRIANLPVEGPEIIIYIYNIAGELVRTLREGEEIEKEIGSKVAKWDCKNEYNRDVASGIYIYLITSNPGKKAQGKIAVIR